MAVVGVIDHGDPVAGFVHQQPASGWHLESGIVPAGVLVHGTPDVSELHLGGVLTGPHRQWETHLQEGFAFLPVGLQGEVQVWGVGVEGDRLDESGSAQDSRDLHLCAQSPGGHDFHRLCLGYGKFVAGIEVVSLDIPRIEGVRHVLEGAQSRATRPVQQHLPTTEQVGHRSDAPVGLDDRPHPGVLHHHRSAFAVGRGRGRRFAQRLCQGCDGQRRCCDHAESPVAGCQHPPHFVVERVEYRGLTPAQDRYGGVGQAT